MSAQERRLKIKQLLDEAELLNSAMLEAATKAEFAAMKSEFEHIADELGRAQDNLQEA